MQLLVLVSDEDPREAGRWAVHTDRLMGDRRTRETVAQGLEEAQARSVAEAIEFAYQHGKQVGRDWCAERLDQAGASQARQVLGVPVPMVAQGFLEDA
jgi:hypothetical protein